LHKQAIRLFLHTFIHESAHFSEPAAVGCPSGTNYRQEFLDAIGSHTGGSFWYELTPNFFVGALVAAYPEEKSLAEKWHTSCQRWAECTFRLWQLNDFNFQAYDLRNKQAVVKQWREPDSAAALAYLRACPANS
jgi:hypothetical protein